MPQTRPANSASAKTAPHPKNSGGKSAAPRLNPNDAGVKRRALHRAKRRRNNALAWGFFVVATMFLSGAVGVMSGHDDGVLKGASGIWKEYKGVQQKIAVKQATLEDLQAQLDRKQRRVSALAKPEGKERALVEGGYLGKDERFLLFPKDKTQADKE